MYLETEDEAKDFGAWIARHADEELEAPLTNADAAVCAARADAERPVGGTCCGCDWDGRYTGPGGGGQLQPTPSPMPRPPPSGPTPSLPPSPPVPTASPPALPSPPAAASEPPEGCADFYAVSLDLVFLPPADVSDSDDDDTESSSSAAFPYWTPAQESHYYYTTDPMLRRALAGAMGLADEFSATLQLNTVRFSPGSIPTSRCGRGIRKFVRYDALFLDRAAALDYISALLASNGGLAGLAETLRAQDPSGVCAVYTQLGNRGRPASPTQHCLGPEYLQTTFQSSTEYLETTFGSLNGRRRAQ